MNSLGQYFRCASGLLGEVAIHLARNTDERGFFFFGPGNICFGTLSRGDIRRTVGPRLFDAGTAVAIEQDKLQLPFHPDEVVANLSRETYVGNGKSVLTNLAGKLVRSAYYELRPVMPLGFRSQLQRFYLRNWRQIPFPKWPVDTSVDELMKNLLMQWMRASGVHCVPFIWFWPNGANGCVLMTHDVEEGSGRDFCSTLMGMNESYKIPASFQVVPEERYEVPKDYLSEIRDRGFELGVQDLNHDGRLFWEFEEFRRRAKRINEYGKAWGALGFRAGILYRNQEWFKYLQFEYDMSVPNVAHLDPQRGGCCTVMPYFIGEILELPVTTTQDHTLFHILHSYSLDLWKQQIEIILRHNGMISFIVHPDYIIEERARSAYNELLAELEKLRHERNVWIAHPNSVNRWWRNRREMTLRQDGEKWVIEGPDSERACLAFAHLEGDSIIYEVAAS